MTFITADRVQDTSTTTGTGNITVSGSAPFGYRTFSTVLSVSDTFYYCIQGQSTSEWEVGLGTYSSANVFARTTVLSSSNSGSAVSFSSGTKNVFITLAAAKTLQIGSSSTPVAGSVPYGTGATLAYSAAGTAGQVLTSGGSGTPTWATASTGTVTSVNVSGGTTGLSASGGPVTTSGTITLAGTLAVVNGGTGVTTSTGSGNTVLSASPTFSGTVSFPGSTTIDSSGNVGVGTSSPTAKLDIGSGNLNFSSTAQRITGDFSNATAANRLAFQSNVTNGNTNVYFIPNGSATTAGVTCFNSSSISNSSYGGISITSTVMSFNSGQLGTGSFLPITFNTNLSEQMRIDSSGNVGIGTSSPNASAILDAQSTTKGVRFPNMTTTQKNAVSSPAAGLVVFDTTLAKLCVYSGSAWQTITSV